MDSGASGSVWTFGHLKCIPEKFAVHPLKKEVASGSARLIFFLGDRRKSM
jgi:hypothetical protein